MSNPFEQTPVPGGQKAKETSKLFPVAMQFMRKMINDFRRRGDDYSVNEFSKQEQNINNGNEYKALEYLEEMTPHGGTINVDEWRLAVNDLSSKRFSGQEKMETDQLREFFDREFDQRDNAMAKEVEENSSEYSRKEIIEWQAKNERWFSAWEQMGQGQGDFRLACQLIEEEIADQLDWQKNHISNMQSIMRDIKDPEKREIKLGEMRLKNDKTFLKIEELRKVRNSLYQKYFKK